MRQLLASQFTAASANAATKQQQLASAGVPQAAHASSAPNAAALFNGQACGSGVSQTNGISGSALQAQQQQQMHVMLTKLQAASGQPSTSNMLAGISAASQPMAQQVPISSIMTNLSTTTNPDYPVANTAPLTLKGADTPNDNIFLPNPDIRFTDGTRRF